MHAARIQLQPVWDQKRCCCVTRIGKKRSSWRQCCVGSLSTCLMLVPHGVLCNSVSLHCIYTSPVLWLSGTNALWKQSSTTLVTSSLPTSAKGFRRRIALAASIQFEIVKDQTIPFAKRIASSVKGIQESGKMLGGLLLTLVHLSMAVAQ